MDTSREVPSRNAIGSLLLLMLPLLVLLAGCSSRTSSPSSPTGSVVRITPADGASGVRLDAPLILDFGTTVERAPVESGLHLIAESDMTGGCPDSMMGPHGPMEAVMDDPNMLHHMDEYHSTHGSFDWNAAGTVCTFVPDSLMHPETRYMVHMDGNMLQMMQGMGGTMMGGRMNDSGDMMIHFQTSTSDGHDGHR